MLTGVTIFTDFRAVDALIDGRLASLFLPLLSTLSYRSSSTVERTSADGENEFFDIYRSEAMTLQRQ